MTIRWEQHLRESVLHTFGYLAEQMWASKRAPENKALRGILQYIELFPERVHRLHRLLFPRLHLRTCGLTNCRIFWKRIILGRGKSTRAGMRVATP